MPALNTPATQAITSWHIVTTAPSTDVSSMATFKTAYGITNSAVRGVATSRITQVSDIGDLGESANTETIALWGEDSIEAALPPTKTPFSLSFVKDYSNALHISLGNLNTGASVWIGGYSTDGTNEAALFIEGTVASNGITNTPNGRRGSMEFTVANRAEYVGS